MQGILIVDKPMDWTSFDVVAKLRGVLGTRKLGHSGTLDPMATGVLPVFCGGASKAVDLQLNHDKSYRAVLKLGARTDTGDVTGTVLETAPVTAGEGELLAVLPQFIGPQMQVPPMYSAIKLNGQPLYKLAREGVTVERKARPIEIYGIEYGGSPAENEYVLTVRCSKGTYIRTLLEEIAAAMGQKGTMSALRRTSAGLYTEADAHTLEEILAAKEQGTAALEALMLPVESVFPPLPLLMVDGHGFSPTSGSLIYAGFTLGMTLGRFTGGWFIDRYSRVTVVRGSAVMGALGIGLIIFVDNPWVAGISVLLWGIGASLGFPLTISAASDTGPDAPKRVSVVAITGYLAFLVGPPLLGFLGEHFGLRSAMMVVLGLVMVAALVARAVAKPQSEPVMENS